MSQDVSLEGMSNLLTMFDNVSGSVDGKEIEKSLMDAAKKVKARVVARAPLGPTGNLKRSIVAKKFKKKIKGSPAVFVAVDYRKKGSHAHLLEYGTVKMAPHPFMRPALDESRQDAVSDIEKGVKDAIKKTWK